MKNKSGINPVKRPRYCGRNKRKAGVRLRG